MLTVNYEKYTRPKPNGGWAKLKKESRTIDERYSLKKKDFSSSTWKEYLDWMKAEKENVLKKKLSKAKKKKNLNNTKAKAQKTVRKAKKPLIRDYQKQLKHELWLKKRKTIIEMDGYQCVKCGSKCNLEVHHTKYYMDKYAWEYPNSTLVTLCRKCHEEVHKDKDNPLYPKYITNNNI